MKKTDKTIKLDAAAQADVPMISVPKVGVPKIGRKIGGGAPLGELASGEVNAPIVADVAPAQPSDAPLLLPKKALVIMRSSGGLRFTSYEVAVYEDGSVTTRDAAAMPQATAAPAKPLTNAQLNRIRDLLTPDIFKAAPKTAPAQKPDRYAYELAARIGRATKRAELADGSIPEEFKKLVAELKKLMPK